MSLVRISNSFAAIFLVAGLCGCQQETQIDSIGNVSARMDGDGNGNQTYKWHILGVSKARPVWQPVSWASRSQWQGSPSNASVVLFGQRQIDMDDTVSSIMIRFDVGSDMTPQNIKMRYFIDGLDRRSYASKGEGTASVNLTTAEVVGDQMHVVGSFEATLPFRRKGKSYTDNVRTLSEGKFDVQIPILAGTAKIAESVAQGS